MKAKLFFLVILFSVCLNIEAQTCNGNHMLGRYKVTDSQYLPLVEASIGGNALGVNLPMTLDFNVPGLVDFSWRVEHGNITVLNENNKNMFFKTCDTSVSIIITYYFECCVMEVPYIFSTVFNEGIFN